MMKFESLLLRAGWCCPWAFFQANKGIRTSLLAARLGVSEDTVRDWAGYASRGRISCKEAKSCLRARGAKF